EGDDAAAVAREAEGPIGAAGGDGSLGAIAEVALERGAPFVCVPFGTRNHFARDVGLDRNDPIGALAAFGSGHEQRIDVGRVAGRGSRPSVRCSRLVTARVDGAIGGVVDVGTARLRSRSDSRCAVDILIVYRARRRVAGAEYISFVSQSLVAATQADVKRIGH